VVISKSNTPDVNIAVETYLIIYPISEKIYIFQKICDGRLNVGSIGLRAKVNTLHGRKDGVDIANDCARSCLEFPSES
jgi:hypothetical protein